VKHPRNWRCAWHWLKRKQWPFNSLKLWSSGLTKSPIWMANLWESLGNMTAPWLNFGVCEAKR
jgi:hypothetical protein